MCAFVALDSFSSVLRQETGRKERLRNNVFRNGFASFNFICQSIDRSHCRKADIFHPLGP